MPESEEAGTTMDEATSELATRWLRLQGAIVDLVILTGIWLGTWIAIGNTLPEILELESKLTLTEALIWMGYDWVIYLVVNGYLLHTRGQTVGKLLAGTRIVGLDGQLLGLPRLFLLRVVPTGLLESIPVVGWVLFILGVLLIFRRDRRCLHDHIAGTKVIMA